MTTNPEIDLLLEAFARNGEVNAVLLADLREEELDLDDGLGGLSIGMTLAHLAGFRPGWLGRISPQHAEGIPYLMDWQDGLPVLLSRSLPDYAANFEAGDRAAVAAVKSALQEGRGFATEHYRSHPAQFLVHAMVHDAHHRGQISSLLRSSGRRSAEQLEALEDLSWPVWKR